MFAGSFRPLIRFLSGEPTWIRSVAELEEACSWIHREQVPATSGLRVILQFRIAILIYHFLISSIRITSVGPS